MSVVLVVAVLLAALVGSFCGGLVLDAVKVRRMARVFGGGRAQGGRRR